MLPVAGCDRNNNMHEEGGTQREDRRRKKSNWVFQMRQRVALHCSIDVTRNYWMWRFTVYWGVNMEIKLVAGIITGDVDAWSVQRAAHSNVWREAEGRLVCCEPNGNLLCMKLKQTSFDWFLFTIRQKPNFIRVRPTFRIIIIYSIWLQREIVGYAPTNSISSPFPEGSMGEEGFMAATKHHYKRNLWKVVVFSEHLRSPIYHFFLWPMSNRQMINEKLKILFSFQGKEAYEKCEWKSQPSSGIRTSRYFFGVVS